MKKRVADYIADLLVENGIECVFAVVGGGAMHLDDAIGNHKGLKCIFNHHEQGSAIAAESYARVNNQLSVACVTSGPGGTNTITGLLCAWNDSIPLLVLSGQVRMDTTIKSTGLNLRQFGEQEADIVEIVRPITKYAEMIVESTKVRYCVEKAIYIATHGRKGPCLLDVPLNIQGMIIETEDQIPYIPEIQEKEYKGEKVREAVLRILNAERPVIIAGSGIRGGDAYEEFKQFVNVTGIPVVAATGIADIFPVSKDGYYGNFGIIGGRAGNFIVQNASCILVLGARLSFKQIGFQFESFSMESYKIMVDVDEEELKKRTISIDLPLCMELKDFFAIVIDNLLEKCKMTEKWKRYCEELKVTFPIYQEKFEKCSCVNPYYFTKILQQHLDSDSIVVLGNSCACDMTRQMGITQEGQRIWGNTNCGTMGYDLPAAIGASVASGKKVFCVTGDGSVMMNLQELQTIAHNKLPVKVIIHNNGGYEAIINTHTNFFGRLTGCTKESGISFPNFKKLAEAFGFEYIKCKNHSEVEEKLKTFMLSDAFGICEVISDGNQMIEPKSKGKILDNGKMYSPPLDDLYPFLTDELYKKYSNYHNYK